MRISFILVEPAVPENVGAAARALMTMGFDRLTVVNSVVHLKPEARWLAHGSEDILESIKSCDTLHEAVAEADLVIGTTAKRRRIYADHYPCYELPGIISQKAEMVENISVVFGREESGLTNEELKLCHIFSGIPMKGSYPSLNLAQAVMIYAWELSGLRGRPARALAKSPSREKLRRLRTMAGELLAGVGFDKNSSVYNRIMERLEAAGDKDAGLIMSVCSKLEELLNQKNDRQTL